MLSAPIPRDPVDELSLLVHLLDVEALLTCGNALLLSTRLLPVEPVSEPCS